MPLARAFAAWLLILALAVLNGVLRESVLLPLAGRRAALLTSGVLLAAAIVVVAVGLARWLALGRRGRNVGVGLLWLGLTLAFEFGFGRLVRRASWDEMLGAYTLRDGNLWPLVLAVTACAPTIAARLRRRGGRDRAAS